MKAPVTTDRRRAKALREEAESRLVQAPLALKSTSFPHDKLLHELQVHQIELEMQNEDLRQSQLAMEESRDRYAHLYDFAPVGYLALTSEGLIAEINLTGASMLGMDRSKLLKRRFNNFFTRGEQDRWHRLFINLKAAAERTDFELIMQRSDGSIFHARLDCLPSAEEADPALIRITLIDISERRRAQLDSARLLRRIESLMKHAHDCVMMFNADLDVIAVSDSCLETYGYSREELLSMKATSFRAPEERPENLAMLKKMAAQHSLSYKSVHCRKDGSRFPVEVGASMIDTDGESYIQVIIRDASEHMRQQHIMETKLAATYQQIKELSRRVVDVQEQTMRRLSAELHDRTSPNLAAIQINLKIVAGLSAAASDERTERLEDTLALIADTEASIREISSEMRPTLLDYAGLPTALEGYAKQYGRRTGIATHIFCVNCEAPFLPGIESLLFRIVQEALTNSAKHSRAKLIHVTLNNAATPMTLLIEDDGVGFNPELITTSTFKGGHGLLNMREMAEFAGGHFAVQSKPGQGTKIRVEIDLSGVNENAS